VFAGDGRHSDEHEDNLTVSSWDAFDVDSGNWESQNTPYKQRTMPLIDNWGQAVAVV
jgi:hypothetical protein